MLTAERCVVYDLDEDGFPEEAKKFQLEVFSCAEDAGVFLWVPRILNDDCNL